mmetsp:Transcript_81766/g.206447  ORF Transcript_81766/g.206447 Transcript_81766/m.206447 type:complete len:122 (-) Transcript_81766:1637-2002(-)
MRKSNPAAFGCGIHQAEDGAQGDMPTTQKHQTHDTICLSVAVGDADWEDEQLVLPEMRFCAAPPAKRAAPLSSFGNESSLALVLSAHAALALAAFGFPMPARRTRSRFICVLSIPVASFSK